VRRAASALPFDQNVPGLGTAFGSGGGTPPAFGLLDDFALYVALREAERASGTGGARNYLVSWPYNISTVDATLYPPLSTGRLFMLPQIVPAGQAIDGIQWIQQTPGVYTAVSTNGVAAYTFDGTTFTRIQQGVNANIWKAAAGTNVQAFAAQVPAFGQDRLVWAAGLWNQSAVTTTPVIAGMTPGGGGDATTLSLGFWAMSSANPGQANFPATFTTAAVSVAFTNHPWLAFYRNYT